MKKNIVQQFVSRAVLIKEGFVLLARTKGEPHYYLPGGRVEIGEKAEKALVREIKEELDLPCKIISFVGCIEHMFEYTEKDDYYEIGHFFKVDLGLNPPEKPTPSEDFLEFFWMKIDELSGKDIRPLPVVDLLSHVLNGNKEAFWASTMK